MHKILILIFIITSSLSSYGQSSFTFQDIQKWWGSKSSTVTALSAGESLLTNEKLYSPNREYYLFMQPDGNLCIYRTKDDGFVWCNMVHGFKNGRLIMQTDGNLVVYDGNNAAKWSSQTHSYFNTKFNDANNKPVKLVLENDGSLQLYTATGVSVWSSK